MKPLKWFITNKQIIKDWTAPRLSPAFMKKARNNAITMELLNKTRGHKFKKILALPPDYDPSE